MTWMGCEQVAVWFSVEQASNPRMREQLRELLSVDPPDLDAVADLAVEFEPRLGALIREEFAELPRTTMMTILRAWRDAVDDGLPFQLVSERPDAPISFARRRLVRVVTEVDQLGITVRLSHIPTRHPVVQRMSA
jgi:hypothetical protein